MKKNLLYAAALLVTATGFAQNNRKPLVNKPIKASFENSVIESTYLMPGTKTAGTPFTPPHTNALCSPVKFTSSPNAFAVGGGVTTYQQNCLSYNKDLNSVLWTTRVSQDWTFSGKTSGSIQATWADVNALAWDSMIIYRDSSNERPARYPGGVLFNPTGNTAISGAQMVGSGPVTSKTGTPAWKGEWYSNRQPSGNYHATNIPNDVKFDSAGVAPFGNVGNSSTNVGFFNIDMQQVGQSVFMSGAMFDYTAPTEVKGAIIGKGAYSGGNFTWSADSLVPGFLNTSVGLISDGLGARLAFSPNGQIGYAVFNGRLSTNFGNSADSTMMPIVYKTSNGGTTWTRVLDGYDWSTCHPELLKNVGALLSTPARHITPNTQHGIDLAVDANGFLHYVTTLTMPYKDGIYAGGGFDSLQYTYTYKWDYVNNHPIIWDLMTDGNNGWKTMMVDSILTSYMGSTVSSDTTATYNAWQNAANFLPYGAHLTVSRATDGSTIFYGWGDSDQGITGTVYNTQPDIMMKAYDVNTGKVSGTINVTNGIGLCFFSYLADQSYYDAGTSSWVVPFVYTIGRSIATPGVFIGTSAVDYYYGNCGSFNATTINTPAVVNGYCAVGIQTYSNHFLSGVNAYPNPSNGTTNITVNLNEPKAINISIIDALGQVIYSKKINGNIGENKVVFDGSSLTAGVYYYTVVAGYEKVTNKLVIQK